MALPGCAESTFMCRAASDVDAGDEVFNQMSKWQAMSADILKMPVVVRVSVGSKYGAQHSQDWTSLCAHIPGLKVPHIGWNSLKYPNPGRLFRGIPEDSYVYFVHSYYLKAQDEGIVTATTEYGTLVHASVESGNLFACQFHPEKSSETGLTILENFLSI